MADCFMAGYWLGTFVAFLVFFVVYLLERWYRRKQKYEEKESECRNAYDETE